MKYDLPNHEGEILPNKLGLTTLSEIQKAEYRGFLKAEIAFEEELDHIGSFKWKLISSIHKTALGHVYEFAGNLRQVNISKGGFLFPAAAYLPQAIQKFEEDFLSTIPESISGEDELNGILAPIHAELLFIHPFREGNGRTARLLADLMAQWYGFEPYRLDSIKPDRMDEYIFAVQSAADQNYVPMTELFKTLR